jgi:hypothetical protein
MDMRPIMGQSLKDEEVDAGAIVGGLFLLFPFIWTMQYKPTHTYELTPSNGEASAIKENIVDNYLP